MFLVFKAISMTEQNNRISPFVVTYELAGKGQSGSCVTVK